MSEQTVFRPATESDRLAAYANVFEVWPCADDVNTHVNRRLASRQHQHAHWFVGVVDGVVATSLGCYPTRIFHKGRVEDAVTIGAVHTRSDHRGQGLARGLFEFVESYQAERGVTFSILYSDIEPGYYERLGYRMGEAEEFQLIQGTTSNSADRLVQIADPVQEIERLGEFYRAVREQEPFFLHRSEDYWRFLFCKHAHDEWYWAESEDGEQWGYVCVFNQPGLAILRDFGAVTRSQLATLIEVVANKFLDPVTGWLPRSVGHPKMKRQPRKTEITMIKRLVSDGQETGTSLTSEEITTSLDWFSRIDQV